MQRGTAEKLDWASCTYQIVAAAVGLDRGTMMPLCFWLNSVFKMLHDGLLSLTICRETWEHSMQTKR